MPSLSTLSLARPLSRRVGGIALSATTRFLTLATESRAALATATSAVAVAAAPKRPSSPALLATALFMQGLRTIGFPSRSITTATFFDEPRSKKTASKKSSFRAPTTTRPPATPTEPLASATNTPAPSPKRRPPSRKPKNKDRFPAPPPGSPRPRLAFFVSRTASLCLPVYAVVKRGGNKKLTCIKKIDGNKLVFADNLATSLRMSRDDVQLNPVTGHVVVKGHVQDEVKKYLKDLGF